MQGLERAPVQALPSQTSPHFRVVLPACVVIMHVAASQAGMSPSQGLSARPAVKGLSGCSRVWGW